MKALSLLFLAILAFSVYGEDFHSTVRNGLQVVDPVEGLSYGYNLRYNSDSKRIYLHSDKGTPNVLYSSYNPDQLNSFTLSSQSPVSTNSAPFVSFDSITVNNVDYIVGSTYSSQTNKRVGMPLLVADASGLNKVSPFIYRDGQGFFAVIADQKTKTSSEFTFYAVGWEYRKTVLNGTGLIAVRGKAHIIAGGSIEVEIKNENVLHLNKAKSCYDVFTEFEKPHLYIDENDGRRFLVLAVPGQCDYFYTIDITNPVPPFVNAFVTSFNPTVIDNNRRVVSTAYDPKEHRLHFTSKKYNSQDYFIQSVVINNGFKSADDETKISAKTTLPIITIDESSRLFIVSPDAGSIIEYERKDSKYSPVSHAYLPPSLNSISSVLSVGKFIYFVTFEPNAKLVRIGPDSFCSTKCGEYQFCTKDSCSCIDGYEWDRETKTICQTKYYVDQDIVYVNATGATGVIVVFFILTTIASLAGWVMWWRGRKSLYTTA